MINALHVLSIGSPESNDAAQNALYSRTRSQLCLATSVWDLSAFLTSGKIDVAILHNTLSATEIRSCAAYIRHNFPAARILLIRATSEILDDPMYDERIDPDYSPETLLAVIEQLAAVARRSATSRRGERTKWQVR